MKSFTKVVSICMIAVLAFVLAACGNNEPGQAEATPTPAPAVQAEAPPAQAQPGDAQTAIPGLPLATTAFTPGTFTASAPSWNEAPLTVSVTFTENQITDVSVIEHGDSTYGQGWFFRSYPGVADQIFVQQSTQNIDAFTGATFTRGAIIEAVEDAIRQAGADPSDLAPQPISSPLPGDRFIPGFHVITVPANTMDIYGNPLTDGATRMLYSEDVDMTLRVSFGRNDLHLHVGGALGLGQGDAGHGESVYPGEIVGGTWGGWWFRQVVNHQINDLQSTNIDIATGATLSASGIAWGVEQAMIAAGADPAEIQPRVGPPQITRNPANPDARFFIPAIYTVTTQGAGGEMTVQVTLDRSTIRRIVVVNHNEPESYWDQVWPEIRDMIYVEQTTNIDLDVFAEALDSAEAIINAVRDAMVQAGETNPDNH